ncbi:MarR family transcriptional regulator [Saxibacter everestensis]|uniref:MarR family transcriptional regulator n=1 Tax=Saxibacter everestensis TaxID=2909229 RepID=A0ABY8QQV8_9MICO|nr:MarR family transcriptional regulator [Brevibacteriaceae bacterium ZFBP1038]
MTAADDPLALERQVCFALSVAARGVIAAYRPILAPLGLTHPQYLVMLALWQDSPQSVRSLGRLLKQDSATLSPLLRRLEKQELITRTRDSRDERVVLIGLTPTGKDLRRLAQAVPGQVMKRFGLTEQDLETIHATMTQLVDAAAAALDDDLDLQQTH